MTKTPPVRLGKLTLGSVPRVVGVVAAADTLKHFQRTESVLCDLVEVRLDLIGSGTADWLARCEFIESMGMPVLLTIRLKAEGGQWARPDAQRAELFTAAIPKVAAIDVELQSAQLPRLAALARNHAKVVVVSYHDFNRTPTLEELTAIVAKARPHASVVKIATLINGDDDIATLRELLVRQSGQLLCVIGMGPKGVATRTLFPTLGSCLTYGYLDQPTAPGQSSATDLVEQLRKLVPAYDQDSRKRQR